jgi:hypothetical protein
MEEGIPSMEDWSKLRHVARLAHPTTGCLVKMRIFAPGALFAGTMYDGSFRRRAEAPASPRCAPTVVDESSGALH